ncbi:MAG: hypothetical protein ACQEQG_00350 [Bacillota bacterium]
MNFLKVITVAILIVILFSSGSFLQAQTEEDHYISWEDHRLDLSGEIFIMDKFYLEERLTEEDKANFSLYMTSRLTEDVMLERYSQEELEILNEYRGESIGHQELLELSNEFTLIGFTASRGFSREKAHEKVTFELSEVVNIEASNIISEPRSHTMLIDNAQLIEYSNARVLPNGSVLAGYILPRIESQFITVEFRSILSNSYIPIRATLEQRGYNQ